MQLQPNPAAAAHGRPGEGEADGVRVEQQRAGGFRAPNGGSLSEPKNSANELFFVPEVKGGNTERRAALFSRLTLSTARASLHQTQRPKQDLGSTRALPWRSFESGNFRRGDGAITFQLEIESTLLYFMFQSSLPMGSTPWGPTLLPSPLLQATPWLCQPWTGLVMPG